MRVLERRRRGERIRDGEKKKKGDRMREEEGESVEFYEQKKLSLCVVKMLNERGFLKKKKRLGLCC